MLKSPAYSGNLPIKITSKVTPRSLAKYIPLVLLKFWHYLNTEEIKENLPARFKSLRTDEIKT